ncbi:UNVERIFIED_CONTAM: non-ribosomal peptide synthetase-like protein [Streptomyces graminofaciens]
MTGKSLEVLATGSADPARRHDEAPPPATGAQEKLALLLADVTQVDEVPLDSHFFDDLGADSLVMAHFCARVRKCPDLPSVSMRDVYRHPTVRDLAAALARSGAAAAAPAPEALPPVPAAAPLGRPHYVWCGVLQAASFVGYAFLVAFVSAAGYDWIAGGTHILDTYLRSVVFGAVLLLVLCALPVLAKWLLIGRWKPERISVWSVAYVRFWLVKTLIRSNPLVLFVGSPLFVLYLKVLGARIGRGVTILSRNVPVCTDLLAVGDGTVIRKDVLISCYRAHNGAIETGPVTLGRDVVVSEATVLDIGTSMGDRAQLGHASSLHTGQAVPDGGHWHGSPAQPGDADFLAVGPARCGAVRRAVHSVLLLLTSLLVYVPLSVGCLGVLLSQVPQLTTVLHPGPAALGEWVFYADLLAFTAVVFFGGVPLVLLLLVTVPRLLGLLVEPGRVYPLYGFHHAVHRATFRLTNRRFMTRLFGDSSCIVHYLRGIGYDLSRPEQTGSNFGTVVKHESPSVSAVGSGTMVSDGLSFMNADYSSTSFRLARTSIGAHNFLGNRITYPSRGRTGDNCLLATKVMVPVDGPLRENTGLLGSPCFEIPRSVLRDGTFDDLKSGAELRSGLRAKNRHNAVTMALFLATGWTYFFCVTVLFAGAADLYPRWGVVALALANTFVLPFTVLYHVLVERVVTAVHRPEPLFCSIYDVRFWRRERYWKVPSETYVRIFNGTPFKSVVWRMLGVRIGSRVFDDGFGLTERPMVAIGDGCTLAAGSAVQCHSQEDGTFKSDRSTIGSGCTLGVGAFVHYGVTVGDGALLEADSFVMKGETVPAHARWVGNPARPAGPEHDGGGGGF